MFRRFSVNFAILSIIIDAVLVAAALWFSDVLRPVLNALPYVKAIPEQMTVPAILYVVFPILWVSVLMVFNVYDGRKNLKNSAEAGSLLLGSMLAAVSMAGILYFSYRDISRFLFLFFWVFALLLMMSWRVIVRSALRWNVMGTVQRKVLILGAGEVGRKLGVEIGSQKALGLIVLGYLDDNTRKLNQEKDVLGTLDIVREVIVEKQVDDVVVALPLSAHERLNQMVAVLHDLPVRVWVIPDYFSLTLHKASVEEFAGIPMLDLRAPALSDYQRLLKRSFDLLMCILIMPFLLPVLGIVAIIIKLDSRGPVFYLSNRIGENGHIFRMIKLRTMTVDADQHLNLQEDPEHPGAVIHKVRNDPRVTRVGNFLRRSSIDELPQFINVLMGDMSLVGPRPELPELVRMYQPWQRKRFAIPQGITGWWQINGRSDRPMHLNTQDDLFYIQHYSLWLDIKIITRTILVVLFGKGAF
ncbi:MAG: sugar transferase [Anaerolineaceae bacterium]|nr:sugar transferase [Anaerolineaceae bacterium]